jgi:hypothetical protein
MCNFFFPLALQPLWALAAYQSPDLFTIGRTPWTCDQPVARPLSKHRTAQTQNKHIYYTLNIHTRGGFEPAITASERSKLLMPQTARLPRPAWCVNIRFNWTQSCLDVNISKFKSCKRELLRKPGGTEIEWDTSASGQCLWCTSIGGNHKYHKEKKRALIDDSKSRYKHRDNWVFIDACSPHCRAKLWHEDSG